MSKSPPRSPSGRRDGPPSHHRRAYGGETIHCNGFVSAPLGRSGTPPKPRSRGLSSPGAEFLTRHWSQVHERRVSASLRLLTVLNAGCRGDGRQEWRHGTQEFARLVRGARLALDGSFFSPFQRASIRGLVLLAAAEFFVPVLHHVNLWRRAGLGVLQPFDRDEALPVGGNVVIGA